MLFLNLLVLINITGIITYTAKVKGTFIFNRITKDIQIFIKPIKYSSGQWWENSVISKRSLVILDII